MFKTSKQKLTDYQNHVAQWAEKNRKADIQKVFIKGMANNLITDVMYRMTDGDKSLKNKEFDANNLDQTGAPEALEKKILAFLKGKLLMNINVDDVDDDNITIDVLYKDLKQK